jgi:hypothetical protein
MMGLDGSTEAKSGGCFFTRTGTAYGDDLHMFRVMTS